ncbi:MAG: serine hydrolase domain-containing protein [Myxococcota bacterium]
MLQRFLPYVLLLLSGCLASGDLDSGTDSGPGIGPDANAPACHTDLTPHLDLMGVPGLSAGIVKNGRLACTAVAGHADVEQNRRVEPDTVFAWASVSKTVTAVAAMILHDQGHLDLDGDIDAVLPFSTRNPHCPGQPITVRQLLTHSSSIVDSDLYDDYYVSGDSPIGLGEFVRGYVTPGGAYYSAEANFAAACPGTVNEYSNVAVGLLGHVVESIANMGFDAFCRERIFAPLGMHKSSFHLANLDIANIAMPYMGRIPVGHLGFPTFPDGLLRSSVPQLARVLAMMAERGVYEGQRILDPATVVEMARVQIPALDDTQGLLWFYDRGGAVLGHDGSDPGISSFMYFDPHTGDGVLMVANGDWYAADDDAPAAHALLGELFAEAASR